MAMTSSPFSDSRYLASARILIVFEDRSAKGLMRLLRPGFRHCFCLVEHDEDWILVDPLKSSVRVEILRHIQLQLLIDHYRSTGRTLLLGEASAAPTSSTPLVRPMSCVELVKRLVRIRAAAVWTPYQLYARLLGGAAFSEPT